MNRMIATLTHVNANSPDKQRRGRILVTICFGVVALLLSVGMGLTLMQPSVGRFVNLGLAVLVFTAAGVLGRKGFVGVGAYMLIVVSIIGAISGVILNPTSPFNTFYLIVSVLLASVLLPPRQIWIVLGLCLAVLAGVIAMVPPEIRTVANLKPGGCEPDRTADRQRVYFLHWIAEPFGGAGSGGRRPSARRGSEPAT